MSKMPNFLTPAPEELTPSQAAALNRANGHDIQFEYTVAAGDETDLVIVAKSAGDEVARASFSQNATEAWPQNTEVSPRWQRQGIATALYVQAELLLGKRLTCIWENDEDWSADARALWAQRNRPFGGQSATT